MLSRCVFFLALSLFVASMIQPAVQLVGGRALVGIETFYFTLRFGTAGLFGAGSFADIVNNLLALIGAAANFALVFWAMLTWSPTRITTLRWFWWVSLLFLLAAAYTGMQAKMSDRVTLAPGYFYWMAALVLMFIAPVVTRLEHRLKRGCALFRRRGSRSGTGLQASRGA